MVIFEELGLQRNKAHSIMTKREHVALKEKQNRRWWLSFFWMQDWFGCKLDPPQDVHFAVVDLNAWTFNGTNNIWASVSTCAVWAITCVVFKIYTSKYMLLFFFEKAWQALAIDCKKCTPISWET